MKFSVNYIKIIIVAILFSLLVTGCVFIDEGEDDAPEGEFLLVELWHSSDGKLLSGNGSEIPILCIDFPTYQIDVGGGKLVDYGNLEKGEISRMRVVYGSGTGLKGYAGSGAASGLEPYENHPVHITEELRFSGRTPFNITIDIMENDTIMINNTIPIAAGGEYIFYSNYTQVYPDLANTTVRIEETVRIKNFGLWQKDRIVREG